MVDLLYGIALFVGVIAVVVVAVFGAERGLRGILEELKLREPDDE